ncbi:MAG: hypothetical protein VB957_12100 [Pseudomonadales bacterium]
MPLHQIDLPSPCTDEQYQAIMDEALVTLKAQYDLSHMAFGDLHLEDIHDYRLAQMKQSGLKTLFPLWKSDSWKLARDMIDAGLKGILSCVDSRQLDGNFSGRYFDTQFLKDLPTMVDPCGENGEFHILVIDGPMFNHAIKVELGDTTDSDDLVFTDVKSGALSFP